MINVIFDALCHDKSFFFPDTNTFHDKCYYTNINVPLFKILIFPYINGVIRTQLFPSYKENSKTLIY